MAMNEIPVGKAAASTPRGGRRAGPLRRLWRGFGWFTTATCVALPVLRFRKDAPAPRFNAPAGAAVAVAAATLSMWLLSNSPSNDARAVGLAAALGLPIFFAYRLLKKPPISAGESDSISSS